MNAAANDDAPFHDFFSAIDQLADVMYLPIPQVAWMAQQVEAERGGIEAMPVGQLLDLIAEAQRRPVRVAGI